ncbi:MULTISPECIES: NUDIX domain-containing protein [Actinomadura]|uniref:NUDIX domain-containing protein n=1 Tax=Actinomadura yumaensis TaxID=111807 RepID=A0ABW2CCN8_9ACTN|nr:NUDIX domain-containing protein [Actinomadura sp. J1-007]MWK33526.1 NUDIX domain-containing protein [Actinomadura sp. J1-007]
MGDGDGWARCGHGHTHWGRFGAAGLLLFHRDPGDGVKRILLQQRAWWGHGGGTWGMFGGGRHSGEDPVEAALRETSEECTLDVGSIRVHGLMVEDHDGWDYASAVASADPGAPRPRVKPASFETRRAEWVPVEDVTERRLFAPFARSWPKLREAMTRVVLVVDAANVVGSRADGWWKDRAGANARLRDDLASLAAGVRSLPGGLVPFEKTFVDPVLVVEGAARRVADEPSECVRVVAAPGSGDDRIVELVAHGEPDTAYLVVTADRELRSRCEAAGAAVTGPRWLIDRLPARR